MDGDEASEPADQKITDVGTTAYRPPELLFGDKKYGCALDLWAAGCVVAEVVARPPHPTPFDSGPLGSDLALIQSIFKTLGTPTDESWPVSPKAKEMRWWIRELIRRIRKQNLFLIGVRWPSMSIRPNRGRKYCHKLPRSRGIW